MIRVREKNGRWLVEQFCPPYDVNWCCIASFGSKIEADDYANWLSKF